ncbi:MAG: ABC transporter substrate-binding protein [Pseudomonadota bacterium]
MTLQRPFSRRSAMALLGAGAATVALPRAASALPIDTLAIYGPPAGPSITLAHAVATDRFSAIAATSTFTAWRNPDELRAGLTSGSIRLSVVPIQAAANLFNRGFPIKLANAMTNGLLYIIAEDPETGAIPDLAGRHIAVPFRGDTPEIIFGQLLDHAGLDTGDLQITYAGSPLEAMQLLLAGRVDAALTAEPSTTAGILRGRQAGREIRRAISIQEAWGTMTGAAPVLPQAGLALTQAFLDDHGDVLGDLRAGIAEATQEVRANPGVAAKHATEALGLPAPLLAASIPSSNLVARPAAEARADIERMLTAMSGPDFERIGGALPGDAFYL